MGAAVVTFVTGAIVVIFVTGATVVGVSALHTVAVKKKVQIGFKPRIKQKNYNNTTR